MILAGTQPITYRIRNSSFYKSHFFKGKLGSGGATQPVVLFMLFSLLFVVFTIAEIGTQFLIRLHNFLLSLLKFPPAVFYKKPVYKKHETEIRQILRII